MVHYLRIWCTIVHYGSIPTWSGRNSNNTLQAPRWPGIVVEMVVGIVVEMVVIIVVGIVVEMVVVIPTQWSGKGGVQLIGDLVFHRGIEREIAYKNTKQILTGNKKKKD